MEGYRIIMMGHVGDMTRSLWMTCCHCSLHITTYRLTEKEGRNEGKQMRRHVNE
jgi:hypothetical protein